MQRDIEEGNFVLKKTTPWQMPDGYSATISGNSGLDTHRHVVNDTGERAPLVSRTPQDAHTSSELREYENGLQESVARHVRPRHVQFIQAGNVAAEFVTTVIIY